MSFTTFLSTFLLYLFNPISAISIIAKIKNRQTSFKKVKKEMRNGFLKSKKQTLSSKLCQFFKKSNRLKNNLSFFTKTKQNRPRQM